MDIILLYSFANNKASLGFDEEKESQFLRSGQHAKLVLMYYDSTNEEELMTTADWNINTILNNMSDNLRIKNLLNQTNIGYSGSSDFRGFTFWQEDLHY